MFTKAMAHSVGFQARFAGIRPFFDMPYGLLQRCEEAAKSQEHVMVILAAVRLGCTFDMPEGCVIRVRADKEGGTLEEALYDAAEKAAKMGLDLSK